MYTLPARAAALLLLMGLVAHAEAATQWLTLRADDYTVVSGLSERDTRAWAAEFDLFTASLMRQAGAKPASLPPLMVVLFAEDADFDEYRPATPAGAPARNVEGIFHRRETFSVIGLAAGRDDARTRRTIFHEGAHWLMSTNVAPLPRWYSEGIAELHSTFSVYRSQVSFGAAMPEHLRVLREQGLLPMREFLAQSDSLAMGEAHTGRYYAQAWALTHLLVAGGDPARRAQLRRYLDAYATQTPAAAFRIAFADDYDGLQRELAAYVAGDIGTRLTATRKMVEQRYLVDRADPVEVAFALGRLALGAADANVALRHADRLDAIAPDAAAGAELRTYIAQRDDDLDAALVAARRAVALGSHDAEMFVVTAAGLAPRDAVEARERVTLLQTAIQLNPRCTGAYSLLIEALAETAEVTEADLAFLSLGKQLLPTNGFVALGLAEQLHRIGRREVAGSELTRVLAHPDRLDDAQLAYARSLRASWHFADLNDRLDPLIDSGHYAEADRLLASAPTDDAATRTYVDQLRRFLQSVLPPATALP